jgi:hypothetical protein
MKKIFFLLCVIICTTTNRVNATAYPKPVIDVALIAKILKQLGVSQEQLKVIMDKLALLKKAEDFLNQANALYKKGISGVAGGPYSRVDQLDAKVDEAIFNLLGSIPGFVKLNISLINLGNIMQDVSRFCIAAKKLSINIMQKTDNIRQDKTFRMNDAERLSYLEEYGDQMGVLLGAITTYHARAIRVSKAMIGNGLDYKNFKLFGAN